MAPPFKIRRGVGHGAALAAVLVLGPVPPAAAAEWRSFANPRFGYSVEIPASFRGGTPPENGDGLSFTSRDGAVTLAAYGHFLSRPGDLRADAQDAEASEVQDGLAITYRSVGTARYAFSGLATNGIVYLVSAATCGRDASATVRIAYPAALKSQMDPIVAHVAASLRGSPRCP